MPFISFIDCVIPCFKHVQAKFYFFQGAKSTNKIIANFTDWNMFNYEIQCNHLIIILRVICVYHNQLTLILHGNDQLDQLSSQIYSYQPLSFLLFFSGK
jgi:hypothetical protein